MTNSSYKAALEASKRELRQLIDQRDEINQRIMKVQTAIVANANMLDDPEEISAQLTEMSEIVTPTGFTDAVRRVLQAAGSQGLTPVEVRAALIESGVDLSVYSNPLSVIHTTLKRLVNRVEAKAVIEDRNETVYQWFGSGKTFALAGLMRPRGVGAKVMAGHRLMADKSRDKK